MFSTKTPGSTTGGGPVSLKPKRRFFSKLMVAAASIRNPDSRGAELFSKGVGNTKDTVRTAYKSAKITVPVLVVATAVHYASKDLNSFFTNTWNDFFNAAKPYAEFVYNYPIFTSTVIAGIVCVNAFKLYIDKRSTKPYAKKSILSEEAKDALYKVVDKTMEITRAFKNAIASKWAKGVAIALIPADLVARIAVQKLDFWSAFGKVAEDVFKAISYASDVLYNNPRLTALAVFTAYSLITFKNQKDTKLRMEARNAYEAANKILDDALKSTKTLDPAIRDQVEFTLKDWEFNYKQDNFDECKRLACQATAILNAAGFP